MFRNQKTKQSDPVGKIKFTDEKLKTLINDILDKTKEYQKKDLEHAVSETNKYNVKPYKDLEKFAKNIENDKL